MRTATRLSPRRRTSVDAKTPYRTGGTPADSFDPIPYASGEKLLQLSSDHAIAELRRRYDTFETVVGMIVSIRSSQPSGTSHPPHEPDKVKLHSLRELIGGYIPKDDVIRRLYECDPRLAMRYTRDEILDRPFRDICGLPNFMLPKRRFWKAEQTFQNAVSKHFSTFCGPNHVLSPLKSASKMRSEMFVRPSKIFVWEG
jgi:hypothetical protein